MIKYLAAVAALSLASLAGAQTSMDPGRLVPSRPSQPSAPSTPDAPPQPQPQSQPDSTATLGAGSVRPLIGGTSIGGADGSTLWGGGAYSTANTPGALMQPSWSNPVVPARRPSTAASGPRPTANYR